MIVMRKFLFTLIALGIAMNLSAVFADPIVELAAPRISPKVIPNEDTSVSPKSAAEARVAKQKEKKQPVKKIKKAIHKKPVQMKVNYDRVSKLIEYGYYDEADRILKSAICRNSNDIKAQSLWAISLAKQSKLDPAQNLLCCLLKKYPNNSDLHYAQGVVYYQRTTSSNMFYRRNSKKFINDALKEFEKAVELDKSNAKAYNAAGVISLNINKPKAAKIYFQKALSIDKTYSMAIDNLGTMDFIEGKYNEAEKKFKQSLLYNTQNTTAMYHLAQIAIQKQDYAAALIHLNNALSINSNSPAIYNLMGKAYAAQGNEAAAINAFESSLSVKPEFVSSYLDLADVYEKRGDGNFAIEKLKTALAIAPDYSDAKLKIADISFNNENYNQAIAFYSELVGIDGYNVPALKGLANSYYGQAQKTANKTLLGSNKDLLRALDCINNAIAANSNVTDESAVGADLELHLAKLKLSKITKQPDLSKIAQDKIISSSPNNLIGNISKGEAYLAQNDYQNAQKAFNSAIKLCTNQNEALSMAEIFIFQKQYDCAEKVLHNILLNNPKNQEAFNYLDYIQKSKKYANNYFKSAQAFLKQGNSSSAIEYLSRSLELNPNNAQARLILAQLYEKQKDYPEALANYKAYLALNPNASNLKDIQKKIKKIGNRL